MRFSIKSISVTLSGLAGICLLALSSCTKDAPFTVNGNPQASAAAPGQNAVVRIISPYDGQTFLVGDSVYFQVTVGDSFIDTATAWQGIVSFYRNNVLIGKDSFPPYVCFWKATAPGQNVLIAKASAGATVVGADTVTVTVRDAFISITSPYNGQVFSPGASIQILASAIPNANHTVARVDFFRNGSFLGSSVRAPYSYMWNNAARGTYEIKVVAHDTRNKLDSAKVTVSVFNVPPSVYLYSPADGSVFFKGDTVMLSAWASDSDGTVSSVLFFKNGKRIGTVGRSADSMGAFTFPWYDTGLGTFTLLAKAIDNMGDTGFSGTVTVTRQDGFIVLNSPRDGQVFETGSAITIAAAAVEAKYHTVKSVKLYRNNRLISTLTKAPYQYTWQNAANGTYQIMAVATDTRGKIDTSNVAAIVVKAIPPAIYLYAYGASGGSSGTLLQSDTLVLDAYVGDSAGGTIASVKFYENGKLIATRYAAPYSYRFPLKNTPVGTYTFYAVASTTHGSTGQSYSVTITVVSKLPQITLTSPANGAVYGQADPVVFSASVKDVDAVRFVQFLIDSQQVAGIDSTSPYSVTVSGLTPGYHMVNAVVVAGSGTYSSVPVFINITGSQPPAPAITLTSPRDSAVFLSTDSILIQAAVSDTIHSVRLVAFYADSAFLGVDSLAPYTNLWIRPAKGVHTLWADETTFSGVTQSSRPVQITVR
jgi:hypothetical protein